MRRARALRVGPWLVGREASGIETRWSVPNSGSGSPHISAIARPCARRSDLQLWRSRLVVSTIACLLVARVDDRVELPRPTRLLLGTDVVDVQQVDRGELVEQLRVARPRDSRRRSCGAGQQPRERVDRDGMACAQRLGRDEHRERRLAGADVALEPEPWPVVEVVVEWAT